MYNRAFPVGNALFLFAGGMMSLAQIFLQGRDIGIVQQLVQKGQPAFRAGCFRGVLHRQAVLAQINLIPATFKITGVPNWESR